MSEEEPKRLKLPSVQTSTYNPTHILSPDFKGTSNYERGIQSFREEKEEKLMSNVFRSSSIGEFVEELYLDLLEAVL